MGIDRLEDALSNACASLFPEKCPGEINNGILKIGSVTMPIYNPSEKMKVPDVLFYENAQVSRILWLLLHKVCYMFLNAHVLKYEMKC